MSRLTVVSEDEMGKKRRYKSGSIRNRGTEENPRWYIGYRINGKQKWEAAGPDRDVAETELLARLVQIKAGRDAELLGTTFKTMAERWLTNVENEGVRPATLNYWRSCVHSHLIPAFGNDYLHQIKPIHVETYRNKKLQGASMPVAGRAVRGRALSTQSVCHHILVLRLIFDLAARDELMSSNPARRVKVPKINDRRPPQPLEPSQVKAIVRAISDIRYRTLVLTMVSLGLRHGEALSLSWDDYDAQARVLSVGHKTVARQKGMVFIQKGGKTPAAARYLKVGDRLHRDLMALKRWTERVHLPDAGNQNLIFRNNEGDLINPSNFRNRVWRTACTEAGVEGAHIHDLRHTYASEALKRNVPPYVLQRRMGHRSASSTNIYSHLMKRNQDEPADNADLY